MIDSSEAFGIEPFGIVSADDDGNTKLYITSVVGDPTGTPAPINTWVFRQDEQILYYKFGTGNNDWKSFNPSDIPAQSINIISFFRQDEQNTTSNGFVTYHDVTTIPLVPADYVFDWTHQLGQSVKNRKVGSRVEWREPDVSATWNLIYDEADGVSVSGGFVPKTSFTRITKTGSGVLQIRDRFGDTDDGGSAAIKESGFKLTRVEDIT